MRPGVLSVARAACSNEALYVEAAENGDRANSFRASGPSIYTMFCFRPRDTDKKRPQLLSNPSEQSEMSKLGLFASTEAHPDSWINGGNATGSTMSVAGFLPVQ